jgi:zinc-ribbon domain
MAGCPHCGSEVSGSFRFCPWCAAPLRLKLVEFFPGHAVAEGERRKALRVSRYLGPRREERHVRFSVWSDEGVAEAAVSLDETEVTRLKGFLATGVRRRGSRRAAARRGA